MEKINSLLIGINWIFIDNYLTNNYCEFNCHSIDNMHYNSDIPRVH